MAAVISCRENTNLTPICLWHDHGGGEADNLKKFLNKFDVKIIERKSRVYQALLQNGGVKPDLVTAGTHLRYDIPLIENEDEFVLYADCDILFQKDVHLEALAPKFFAASPEFHPDMWYYFNSGVMLMNVDGMRRTSDALLTSTLARMNSGFPVTHDQSDLNGFYFDQWDRLPSVYNWKPYWGKNDHAVIVHFHGVKPQDAYSTLLSGDHPDPTVKNLVDLNTFGYTHYLGVFATHLEKEGYELVVDMGTNLAVCIEKDIRDRIRREQLCG